VAENLKLKKKAERHTRAPGEELYRLPRKTPLWLKILLAPFLTAGALIGILVLAWFTDILFDTGIIH
jgi:hypothetical protein